VLHRVHDYFPDLGWSGLVLQSVPPRLGSVPVVRGVLGGDGVLQHDVMHGALLYMAGLYWTNCIL